MPRPDADHDAAIAADRSRHDAPPHALIMISAAAVTTRALCLMPVTMASFAVAPCTNSSRARMIRKTS